MLIVFLRLHVTPIPLSFFLSFFVAVLSQWNSTLSLIVVVLLPACVHGCGWCLCGILPAVGVFEPELDEEGQGIESS